MMDCGCHKAISCNTADIVLLVIIINRTTFLILTIVLVLLSSMGPFPKFGEFGMTD